MAGESQKAKNARTRESRARLAKEAERELAQIGSGHHDPPMPAVETAATVTFDLDALEQMAAENPEQSKALADLWPDAHAALEEILNDAEASAASRVAAARIVAGAREAELKAASSNMPTRIIFETAAYVGEAA